MLIAGPGSLAELSQLSRDANLNLVQPSFGLGVIGHRRNSNLGAISDNFVGSIGNSGGAHNHIYNIQMLDVAYKLM